MRVEADRSVQHVAHESKRAAGEQIMRNGRSVRASRDPKTLTGGVLPQGTAYVHGMRTYGTIAYASIYDQAHLSEAGRVPAALPPFRLERRVAGGQQDSQGRVYDLWITDLSRGKTYVTRAGEVRGLSLAAAQALAAGNPQWLRVVLLDAWGGYSPASVVPAGTKGKKGAAGMW